MTDNATDLSPPAHLVNVLAASGDGTEITAALWHGGEDGHEDDYVVYLMDVYGSDPHETAYFASLEGAAAYAVEHVSRDLAPT